MIDFIGIGAQKSGTSWVYACLYEHPQICAPIKEIHFFSRERFSEGKEWYESHFKKCSNGKLRGEFSTSYLYSNEAPERIKAKYPDVKLIAILRNPISRAISQYGNAIKAGEIKEEMTCAEYFETEVSALEQGLYAGQLEQYFSRFDRSHILVLIYEDSKKDPQAFIKKIYNFLGVDSLFVPSMLHDEINVARVPKHVGVDRGMHYVSEFLRRNGLDTVVHMIRRLGIPDLIRTLNTKPKKQQKPVVDHTYLVNYFKEDVARLSTMLDRDLGTEWGIVDTHNSL